MKEGRAKLGPEPVLPDDGARHGRIGPKGELMRILAVDDSEDARDIMAVTLSSGGYEDVTFATSGEEALARLAQRTGPQADIDLVLLDVVMPGMDGIELCARIRADPVHADLPILMVSSLSDADSLSQAFIAGANDYVTKPIHRLELLARIRSVARLRGERDLRLAREAELRETGHRPDLGSSSAGGTSVDPLTGLLNWSSFEAIVQALPDGRDHGIAAIAWQIDDLDRIRVRDGEQAVRDLIRGTAQVLQALPARLGDHLAHYDNGIFVALVRGCSERDLADLADRAQADLATARDSGKPLSVGIAHGRDRTPRQIITDAIAGAEGSGARAATPSTMQLQ